MTEVSPPNPKAGACPAKAQAAGAATPADAGFQDTLATVVALATPAPKDGTDAAKPGTGAADGAHPAEPSAGPPPGPLSNKLPTGALTGEEPAASLIGDIVAARPGRTDPLLGKDAGRESGKDRSTHITPTASEAAQPPSMPAQPNACVMAAVVPLPPPAPPPLVGAQAGAAARAGVDAATAAIEEAKGGSRNAAPELPGRPAPIAPGNVERNKTTAREPPGPSAAVAKPSTVIGAVPSSPAPVAALPTATLLAPTHVALPPVSTLASPTAPPPSMAAPAQSPAGQVAPVVVSLAAGPVGTHHLVLRLDPPDLGHVEIRVDRGPDASASVAVVADRPATLALLRQDAPALHQALTDAGIPTHGRSLTMQLGHPGGQFAAGQGNGGQGGWTPRRFGSASLPAGSESARPSGSPLLVAPRGLLSALDITA